MKWLADECFDNDIIRGLLRHCPSFDIARAQDIEHIDGVTLRAEMARGPMALHRIAGYSARLAGPWMQRIRRVCSTAISSPRPRYCKYIPRRCRNSHGLEPSRAIESETSGGSARPNWTRGYGPG